ncbi:DUF1997 domain-containing protein [Synechococcus sp. M16CYN]|uniref:DUF1997 domain-containing protein n=1 Tax=Synechococcus sp. M16CYN TaxID=3103139 RepID=UPI00334190D7
MPLAFEASQKMDLPVQCNAELLPDYLQQEERVLRALLDTRQLRRTKLGHYRYLVTSLQVFQLQVKPVVSLEIETKANTLVMKAVDCELEGLSGVDDFQLSLESRLTSDHRGLNGHAHLAVRVSQPQLLRLIPRYVLESTGESILNGILIGIKSRVGKQLINDFNHWCTTLKFEPSSQ